MKKEFSSKWKSSKQTRKQRKYLAKAPLHLRKKIISSQLSTELKKKYNKRNISLRKGDMVLITIGSFKDKKGKISSVDLKKKKVIIEGIQRTKRDGSKVNVVFDASNLKITELNLEDKKRIKKLEDKKINKEPKEHAH